MRYRYPLLTVLPVLFAVPVGLAVLPCAAAAQIGGVVRFQGWEEPAAGAEVQLLDDSALTVVATAHADDDGRFAFPVIAPGIYHLQAHSGSAQGELLGPFEVRTGDETDALVLELPSALLLDALACLDDGAGDTHDAPVGVLVGVAYEDRTGMPLPGALVSVEWSDGERRTARRTATTDARGHYRLCDAPGDVDVHIWLTALNRVADVIDDVRIEGGAIVRIDLPLRSATISAEVDARVEGRPIALDPIHVEGRVVRASPFARRAVTGAELERAIERGAMLSDLVRASFPLQVLEWRDSEGRYHLCIEGRRREIIAPADVYALDDLPNPCGETVAIVVDDVVIHDPVGFYRSARLDLYELIEYVAPLEAGIRYGLTAGRAGAIVLWSIGRTPAVRR